jgi:hypothetical protein
MAALTGKIGGGATQRVYSLASVQLPGVLNDLEWHAKRTPGTSQRVVNDLKIDLQESLASIVEFDGLETLLNPSPRSSLTVTVQ